jgi:hypothetical protein
MVVTQRSKIKVYCKILNQGEKKRVRVEGEEVGND